MSTSAIHNAIMEADGKDRAPMLVSVVTHPLTKATQTSATQTERSELETYSTVSDEKKKLTDAEVVVLAVTRPRLKYKVDNVRVVLLGKNQEKVEAVRKGMLHSRGKLLLVLAADGASKVDDVAKLENQDRNDVRHKYILGNMTGDL
ncbi:hypothetical protein Tco_1465829 [Tanacetum coccineum]